jgi:hypothetical protein
MYIPTEGNTYACPCSADLAGQRVYGMTAGCYITTNYDITCNVEDDCADSCCPTFIFAEKWWTCEVA